MGGVAVEDIEPGLAITAWDTDLTDLHGSALSAENSALNGPGRPILWHRRSGRLLVAYRAVVHKKSPSGLVS